MQQKHCDPSYPDVEEQTPLHHTCGWLSECTEEEALAIAGFLIRKARCDPNTRDVNGKSCVLHACEKGFLTVLQFFVEELECDLSVVDYRGNNALHLAVSFSDSFALVRYIMSKEVVDLEVTNNSKNNILHMAAIANSGLDICKLILDHSKSTSLIESLNENGLTPLDLANQELIRYVLTRFQIHSEKFYQQYALSLGVKQCPTSPARVFVLGSPKSGKTTLISSLQKEGSSFSLSFSSQSSSPVLQLVEEAHGLTVTNFESKSCGNIAFYDFSGQTGYEHIQESILHHSIHPSFSTCVIVINQQKSSEHIKSSVHHWLSLLDRAWGNKDADRLMVVIVGTHVDIVKSSSKSHQGGFKSISLDTLQTSYPSFEFSKVQVDCHRTDHTGIITLRKLLSSLCSKISGNSQLSFNASCLLSYLNSTFSFSPAVSLGTLLASIRQYELEKGTIHDVRYFLSEDESIIARLLLTLEKKGHIYFLRDEASGERGVILIQAHEVFADLTKLWSRADSISSHGLLPLSSMASYFPSMAIDALMSILSGFKLCIEINVTSELSSSEFLLSWSAAKLSTQGCVGC